MASFSPVDFLCTGDGKNAAVTSRSASVEAVGLFLGCRLRTLHLQLSAAAHPGCSVGGGTQRRADEGPPIAAH